MNIKLRDTPAIALIESGKLYKHKNSGLLCFAVKSSAVIHGVGLRNLANGDIINISNPNSWEDVTKLFTLVED